MLPNSGLDEMKQHHLQLGGFAPSVLLHWLQKEIPQDLVEFPFCFLHKKLSNRKWWSGETRYSLWISCYKWADKKFWLMMTGWLHTVLGHMSLYNNHFACLCKHLRSIKGKLSLTSSSTDFMCGISNMYSPLPTPPHAHLTSLATNTSFPLSSLLHAYFPQG